MTPGIMALLEEKKVIVCCGAGGVGKTTVGHLVGFPTGLKLYLVAR